MGSEDLGEFPSESLQRNNWYWIENINDFCLQFIAGSKNSFFVLWFIHSLLVSIFFTAYLLIPDNDLQTSICVPVVCLTVVSLLYCFETYKRYHLLPGYTVLLSQMTADGWCWTLLLDDVAVYKSSNPITKKKALQKAKRRCLIIKNQKDNAIRNQSFLEEQKIKGPKEIILGHNTEHHMRIQQAKTMKARIIELEIQLKANKYLD
jgi:hypothetical protein